MFIIGLKKIRIYSKSKHTNAVLELILFQQDVPAHNLSRFGEYISANFQEKLS